MSLVIFRVKSSFSGVLPARWLSTSIATFIRTSGTVAYDLSYIISEPHGSQHTANWPLHVAAERGDMETARGLVAQGTGRS